MAWTEEQQLAIDLDQKNILVSAAAGSGKTAVLVERVVSHLLRDPEKYQDAWDIDKLLVVTFTKAAAAEMRERIGIRLQKAISEEISKEQPDQRLIRRLERQNILLTGASISTIDSFCQSIIRNNFVDLDIDPGFRVADENELKLLQQDVLEELFEAGYASEDPDLLHVADLYGTDHGDENLYKIILNLHSKAMNHPFPEAWLNGLVNSFVAEGEGNKHLSDYKAWWQIIRQEISQNLAEVKSLVDEFHQLQQEIDEPKAIPKYQAIYDRYHSLYQNIHQALDKEWEDIYQAFHVLDYPESGFLRMPSSRGMDKDLAEKLKNTNDDIKAIFKDLQKGYVLDDEATMLGDLLQLGEDVKAVVNLTLRYLEAYAQGKKEKNILDFNDMEHFALKLLLAEDATPEDIKPSAVALALRKKYQEIMVDEYQDSNSLQNTLMNLIAGDNRGNLFTVGDVKQSIYGFRSSEPSLFLSKYDQYAANQGQDPVQLINLKRNFRSRKEVLSGINFIFGQLMSRESMEIEYDQQAMLNPGDPYGYVLEPAEGKKMPLEKAIELDIISVEKNNQGGQQTGTRPNDSASAEDSDNVDQEEMTKLQLEAQHIANRLKELYYQKYLVFDNKLAEQGINNGYREVQWRDMVILLRATNNKADVYQSVLQANDIPVYGASSSGYFKATEIQIITSLLEVIDNAQQDIPLAAVLYSPIVGLNAVELAELRLVAPGENLYAALLLANAPETNLPGELKQRLGNFVTQLSQWRQLAQGQGVPELLWQLYMDTGYYDYVGCMPGGMLRQANLRMLITRAREFEATDYRGLFRFLSFLGKIKKLANDLSEARTMGENEDVVRVMTIHKSKGLEFPIVVFANTDKKFNKFDAQEDILIHRDLGLGMRCIDVNSGYKYPSFSHIAVKCKILQESNAEELRVMYVAMTRAKEKLIITGAVKDLEKKIVKWSKYFDYRVAEKPGEMEITNEFLPPYMLGKGDAYLEWLAPAMMRHPKASNIAELVGLTSEQYVQQTGYMRFTMGGEAQCSINIIPEDILQIPQNVQVGENSLLASYQNDQPMPVEEDVMAGVRNILNWQYDFQGTQGIPAKLSVSELKRRFAEATMQQEDNFSTVVQVKHTFPQPAFMEHAEAEKAVAGKGGYGGAEYGTLIHNVLQHMDIQGDLSDDGITAQLEDMVAREIITWDQSQLVKVEQIQSFLDTTLGQRMQKAKKLWRELPFSRMIQAKEYYPTVTDEAAQIFNQGVIDVLFEEENGQLILLDYKTDWNTKPEQVKAKYQIQVELYCEAVKAIFGRTVSEKYLFMLKDSTVITI